METISIRTAIGIFFGLLVFLILCLGGLPTKSKVVCISISAPMLAMCLLGLVLGMPMLVAISLGLGFGIVGFHCVSNA